MFQRTIETTKDWQFTVMRLILGVIFFAHGLKKTFGTFDGPGYTKTMNGFMHGAHHFPWIFAFLAVMAEFLGGIGLVLGALTRVAAFGLICNMVVAIATVNGRFGLFANWGGDQSGEGYEFHLLVIAICIALVKSGGGALSVDRLLIKMTESKFAPVRAKL